MSINLVGGENSTYSLIKQGIKASTTRAKAISNNIANINTKGYKRFSVVFEENINGSGQTDLQMKTTNEKHLSNSESLGDISVKRDNSTSMRTDGNNVDLDVEKVEQAANTLKYNALIQSANSKLTNLKYVISGGN